MSSAQSRLKPTRIVILGGGWGGLAAARSLERLLGSRAEVDVTLISRDNYFLVTPLLFEACSGTLELRHCSISVRESLQTTNFIEATVRRVDLDTQTVEAAAPDGTGYEIPYDQLVLTLGSVTNQRSIPGSEHALTFKTMADALLLRNHFIECFERASVDADSERRRALLTFVVVGGGLVGVELFGELTAFRDSIARYYPRISPEEIRFRLFEYGPRILPEVDPVLADYAAGVLERRRGVSLRTGTQVLEIGHSSLRTADETLRSETIILCAGILPGAAVTEIAVEKDRRGHVTVDETMRSKSHPNVWALGDCASIPGPDGRPYPYLAQHALREAKTLARNLCAVLAGRPPKAFLFGTLGIMASLGHATGLARILGLRVRGFPAWWFRRTYYLFQMPHWSRRMRIIADWTVALLFRPDIAKIDLADERALLARNSAAGTAGTGRPGTGQSPADRSR
jgi:NADH:quinone reductase (non-electrogenic)